MSYKLNNSNFKINFKATNEMLFLCDEINNKLLHLPIKDLSHYPQLRKRNRILTVHSTCKIEHNQLSLSQVTDVINHKRVIGEEAQILEVKNAYAAYNQIDNIDPYSIESLLYVHGIMSRGLVEKPGRLRNQEVKVRDEKTGEVVYYPPHSIEVPGLMSQLFFWLTNFSTPIIIKSCVFHYYFECIHPFTDTNGRMGRLWQIAILCKVNKLFKYVPIEKIIVDNMDKYYHCFESEHIDYNCTEFIEFMLKAINDKLSELINDTKKEKPNVDQDLTKMLKLMVDESYSSGELMKLLKVKTRNWLLIHYVQPALKAGLIEMTIPNKPKSKKQRYKKVG